MATSTYFMTIPAANTSDNHPSNGYGGVTTSASARFRPLSSTGVYRIYGITCIAAAASPNLITVKDLDGTTVFTTTLPASLTANFRVAVPDNANTTASGNLVMPFSVDGGLPIKGGFTISQGNVTTWSINVLFTVEPE